MKPWHYQRIKIPLQLVSDPYQAPAGNWVFFFIGYLHDAKKTPFRVTHLAMHTIGLDGVEE